MSSVSLENRHEKHDARLVKTGLEQAHAYLYTSVAFRTCMVNPSAAMWQVKVEIVNLILLKLFHKLRHAVFVRIRVTKRHF